MNSGLKHFLNYLKAIARDSEENETDRLYHITKAINDKLLTYEQHG